jgi:hypothetical protein
MKLLWTKWVRLDSIQLRGRNLRDPIDQPAVDGQVETLRSGGVLLPVRVDTRDGVLNFGYHRYAAYEAFYKERKTPKKEQIIRCEGVRYDDENEKKIDRLSENMDRRQLSFAEKVEATRQRVELRQRRLSTEASAAGVRRDDSKVRAVRQEAEAQKVTDRTIFSRLKKAADSGPLGMDDHTPFIPPSHPADTPPTPPITPPQPTKFRTFGLPIPEDIRAGAVQAQVVLAKVEGLLKQAQVELTKLIGDAPAASSRGYRRGVMADLHREVHQVAHLVRSNRPAGLCPYCKACPGITCMSCAGSGVAGASLEDRGVPPRLMIEGETGALVSVDGQEVSWSARCDPPVVKNGEHGREVRR